MVLCGRSLIVVSGLLLRTDFQGTLIVVSELLLRTDFQGTFFGWRS